MYCDNKKIIYSNINCLDQSLRRSQDYKHIFINADQGRYNVWEIIKYAKDTNTVILNNDDRRLFKLCALRFLFPFRKFKLISIDILLRKPN